MSVANNASGLHCHLSTKFVSGSNILVASGSGCEQVGIDKFVSTGIAG